MTWKLLTAGLLGCAPHNPRALDALFPDPVTVIAHRGGPVERPENTHAAFALSASRGFSLELDVTATRDGALVVIHDDTLDRTTDRFGYVDQLPAEHVLAADAGARHTPPFPGETVPRLEEVLARYGSEVVLDVEIKSPRDEGPLTARVLGSVVAVAIERAGLAGRVLVTSFNPYVLEGVRQTAPAIARGQLVGTYEGTDLSPLAKLALTNLWLNRRAVPDAILLEDPLCTPARVERLRKLGYRVGAWTVNDPARWAELVDLGVSLVITDTPVEAAAALRP